VQRTCTRQLAAGNLRRRARVAAARSVTDAAAAPAGAGGSSERSAAPSLGSGGDARTSADDTADDDCFLASLDALLPPASPLRDADSHSMVPFDAEAALEAALALSFDDADFSGVHGGVAPAAAPPPLLPPLTDASRAAALASFDTRMLPPMLLRDFSAPQPGASFFRGCYLRDTAAAADTAWPAWPPLAAAPARAEVKLDSHAAECLPGALPPGLAPAAGAALFARLPMVMSAAVAPGCTLLTFEAVVPCAHMLSGEGARLREEDGCGVVSASSALRALLNSPGGVGAYFRARECVRVSARGAVATARHGVLVEAEGSADAALQTQRLPQLLQLAASCDAPVAVRAAAPLARRELLRCRLNGRFLTLLGGGGGDADADAPAVVLAAAGEEGVALLERAAAPAAAFAPRAPPRPLLLTSDAALAAELNGSAPEALRRDAEAAERAVCLLGHALRPCAPPALLAAAAAACMRQRWQLGAERCLAALAAARHAQEQDESSCSDDDNDEEEEADADVAASRLLLHEAVASGSVAAVRAVLAHAAGSGRFGAAGVAAAGSAWPQGVTPLHLAAASTSAADIVALLTCCDGDSSGGGHAAAAHAAGADAAVAWLCARDAAGVTPSDVARARRDDSGDAAALRALDAALRRDLQAARQLACASAVGSKARLAVRHWPHLAALASSAIDAAAAARAQQQPPSPHARRVVALAHALLRDSAAAWARRDASTAAAAREPAREEQQQQQQQQQVPASQRRPQVGDATALIAAAEAAAAESAWRLRLFRSGLECVCIFQGAFHAAQLRLIWCPPAAVATGPGAWPAAPDAVAAAVASASHALSVPSWSHTTQAASDAMPVTLWWQLPCTAALALALITARGRALLARRLQAVLFLQFVAQALLATMVQAGAVHAVHAPLGLVVLWPSQLGGVTAGFTLLLAVCFPMAPRAALPLLALRGVLPALAVFAPQLVSPVWPCSGRLGAALQVGAAACAAAHTVRRERRLRALYARHVAALAADAASAAGAAGTSSKTKLA
jgi:hypothetical protein